MDHKNRSNLSFLDNFSGIRVYKIPQKYLLIVISP